MPIYAYRCSVCGHAQDVLQKISAPVLTVCPACGQDTYAKQVTAAGFQLKGSGWYVTDFRGGNAGAKDKPAAETSPATSETAAGDKPAGDKPASPAAADKPAASPAVDKKAADKPASPSTTPATGG